jgi:hypothetical protein
LNNPIQNTGAELLRSIDFIVNFYIFMGYVLDMSFQSVFQDATKYLPNVSVTNLKPQTDCTIILVDSETFTDRLTKYDSENGTSTLKRIRNC